MTPATIIANLFKANPGKPIPVNDLIVHSGDKKLPAVFKYLQDQGMRFVIVQAFVDKTVAEPCVVYRP